VLIGSGLAMMSRLNIASLGLAIGATGQTALYAVLAPRVPVWMIFGVLIPPWLTVYTISFCRKAPFGPRRFRHCLIFAMCWYAATTVLAEILHVLIQPAPWRHFPTIVARVLTYLGVLSFVVFIRACVLLRRLEMSEAHD